MPHAGLNKEAPERTLGQVPTEVARTGIAGGNRAWPGPLADTGVVELPVREQQPDW